jgi:hypothetical protein
MQIITKRGNVIVDTIYVSPVLRSDGKMTITVRPQSKQPIYIHLEDYEVDGIAKIIAEARTE